MVRADTTDADRRSATRVWDDVWEDVRDVDLLREWGGEVANADAGPSESAVCVEEAGVGDV